MDIITLVIELAILLVLIDDVYGITNLHKAGKRKLRRFLRTSAKYFKGDV